jgi:hypothetical protein
MAGRLARRLTAAGRAGVYTRLLWCAPRLHPNPSGAFRENWSLGRPALRFLRRTVRPGDATLETGVGVSTVLLALLGARHTAITPDPREVDRVRQVCEGAGISLRRVDFLVGRSAQLLPRLPARELDLLLLDGSHAFPAPFLDWYYAAPLLRVGGVLLVDDVQLWPCGTLSRFLDEETGWSRLPALGRAAGFRVERPVDPDPGWMEQPFVVARSAVPRRGRPAGRRPRAAERTP